MKPVLTAALSILWLAAAPLNRFDAYTAPYVAQREFSGVVYVGDAAGERYHATAGSVHNYATVFAVGSVSKTFTAAAIELLAARGKLHYSDALRVFVPEYSHAKEVTIDELLNHTAGIPDFYSIPGFASVRERDLSLPQIVQWLNAYPLDFKPGTKSNYSNSGYILLALAIERASGETYAKFLKDNIFAPMGLTHTSAGSPGAHGNVAAGHDPGPPPSGVVAAAIIAPGWFAGNGSIYSNASDLSRWLDIAAAGKLVNFASLPYRAGWGKRTYGGDTVLEQDGRIPGYASYISIDEKTGLKVIVLSNIQSAAASTIGHALRRIAVGEDVSTPAARAVYAPRASEIAAIAGTYGFPGLPLVVTAKDGALFLSNANDGMQLVLDPVAPNTFFFRPLDVLLTFKAGPSGEIESIDWGGQFTIPRTHSPN